MAKNVIKELIITLLLCLAIILVLGILLYEYVPMSKTIPNPVSYTTPEDVKQELAQVDDVDENQIVRTYEIDSNDLNNFRRIQDYRPGKANPFSSYVTSPDTSEENSNPNGNNSQTSDNTQNTSGGKFFQNKGTK